MLELLTGRKSCDRYANLKSVISIIHCLLPFSFVFLSYNIHVLTRLLNSRSLPRGEQFLVRWAVPRLHDIDALSRMVDPSLNGMYPAKSLSRFADIISSCIMVTFSTTFAWYQVTIDTYFSLLTFLANLLAERAWISAPDLRNCTGTLTNAVEESQKLQHFRRVEDWTKCWASKSWYQKVVEACFQYFF